ncbi:MAG: hypothetical protein IPN80_07920 [Flavobacterium sp.]|nr:hypothetical protein [Flavobacterium sp.]
MNCESCPWSEMVADLPSVLPWHGYTAGNIIGGETNNINQIFVARLDQEGLIDTSFGIGKYSFTMPHNPSKSGSTIRNGKIIIAFEEGIVMNTGGYLLKY